MDSYSVKLSLRVWHPSIDPAEITSELQIEPRRSWRAGKPRTPPKGKSLGGFSAESYWVAPIDREADGLPRALRAALERLAAHRTFFHRIRSEGGKAEIFIGWFFNRQSGDTFEWDLLAQAADLRIGLSFDVYPPDKHAGGEDEADPDDVTPAA